MSLKTVLRNNSHTTEFKPFNTVQIYIYMQINIVSNKIMKCSST